MFRPITARLSAEHPMKTAGGPGVPGIGEKDPALIVDMLALANRDAVARNYFIARYA